MSPLAIKLSEGNHEWRPIPRWADFLIRLGYGWPYASRSRRVALVSMPCDSPAPGLIALGALIRDLANPNANDLGAHYMALLRFARQFLESCSNCEVRCDPELKGCGYFAEAKGILRHKDGDRYRVMGISEPTEWGDAIKCSNDRETRWLLAGRAGDWTIDGEPAPQQHNETTALIPRAYTQLVEGTHLIPENLTHSFSGLCLAGRVGGESATREICRSIRFRTGNDDYNLLDLLTVHGWSQSNTVSRMSFYNSRTERFDRYACAPSLVVADGDTSFLRVIGHKQFQRSDVIGVVQRTLERERLEVVGTRMADLLQWYAEDAELTGRLSSVPSGMSVSVLRQRS